MTSLWQKFNDNTCYQTRDGQTTVITAAENFDKTFVDEVYGKGKDWEILVFKSSETDDVQAIIEQGQSNDCLQEELTKKEAQEFLQAYISGSTHDIEVEQTAVEVRVLVDGQSYWVWETEEFYDALNENLQIQADEEGLTWRQIKGHCEYLLSVINLWLEDATREDCQYSWEETAVKIGQLSEVDQQILIYKVTKIFWNLY